MPAERFVGYDPGRVAALALRTIAAIDDLRAATTADGAAAGAMARLANVRFALETVWLPAIHRVGADGSMAGWSCAGPAAATLAAIGAVGAGGATRPPGAAAAADEIDAAMQRLAAGDDDALDELDELLEHHGADAEVLVALLEHWGAAGLFANLMVLGRYPEGGPLAARIVDGFEHLSAEDAFGHDLADVALSYVTDWDAAPTHGNFANPYTVVAFLASNPPAGFPRALASGVTDHAAAGGGFVSPVGYGWPSSLQPADFPQGAAFPDDPVAASLLLLTDPRDARAFYADAERARYLFVEHDFRDGYAALFTSWGAACAGQDLRDPANPPTEADVLLASEIAALGVAALAERGGFAPEDVSLDASVAAATVVTTHLIAGEATVIHDPGTTASNPTLMATTHLSVGDAELTVAQLNGDGLDRLVGAAGTTAEGIAIGRAGTPTFHARTADGLAAEATAVEDGLVGLTLTRAGALEAYLIETMWNVQEDAGRRQDELIEFWVGTAGDVATLGLKQVDAVSRLAAGVSPIENLVVAPLATGEAAAVARANTAAETHAQEVELIYINALAAAGLLELPEYWDAQADPSEQLAATGDNGSEVVNTAAAQGFPVHALDVALKALQLDHYHEQP